VIVPVVDVRIMSVCVHERLVSMPVSVRNRVRNGWVGGIVRVPMMLVVHMRMVVLHRFVQVLMLVPLCEMQPDACRHQRRREQQKGSWALVERGE
jgi:hypothetical protein